MQGLKTVTEFVPAEAMSAAVICAVSCEALTNAVARALPFQLTTEAGMNSEPLTVRVKAPSPGTVTDGIRGWLMKGTGEDGFTTVRVKLCTASGLTPLLAVNVML